MLKVLDLVDRGVFSPSVLKTAELFRRSVNLSLSATATCEASLPSSSVLSLDLDPSNGRFLLGGLGDGRWTIHDTWNVEGKGTLEHSKRLVEQGVRGGGGGGGRGHSKAVNTVEWYPAGDGGLFATSSSDGTLKIWDANEPSTPVETFAVGGGVINRHHINPQRGTDIAVCTGGKVKLGDIRTGTTIQKLPETGTRAKEVRWRNGGSGHELVVGTDGGHILEWDTRSTLQYRGYGLLEVKVARRGVRTRDFTEQVGVLQKAHSGAVTSLRYSNDGLELFSNGADGRIRRWIVDPSQTSTSEPCIATLHYSAKGKRGGPAGVGIAVVEGTSSPVVIVPSTGPRIAVCCMKQCCVVKELVGHFKDVNCFVYDNVFGGSGYSGGNDGAIMVWTGHAEQENAWLEDKLENSIKTLSTKQGRRSNASRNLIDDEDDPFEVEYEVPDSSSSNNNSDEDENPL